MTSNGAAPPEDQEPRPSGLSSEVADMIRQLINEQLSAALPQHVRQEVRAALPEIQQIFQSAVQAGQTAEPAQEPEPTQADNRSLLLNKLLQDPLGLIDRAFERYFEFKRNQATLNIDTNPIASAQYLQAKFPMVMNMFAPNPWGDGFQQMMANSFDFGGKMAWDQARRVIKYSKDLNDVPPAGIPTASPPSNSSGSPSVSGTPPQTNGLFTKYAQQDIDSMLVESLSR